MQRRRVLDLHFLEMLVVVGDRDVEPAVRDDAALVEGIFRGVPQRDEVVVALAVGEVEAGGPAHRFERRLARPFQLLGERLELAAARRAVEAADAHVDRMDLAPAERAS